MVAEHTWPEGQPVDRSTCEGVQIATLVAASGKTVVTCPVQFPVTAGSEASLSPAAYVAKESPGWLVQAPPSPSEIMEIAAQPVA